MKLSAALRRIYEHPILDFSAGIILIVACMVDLKHPSPEPLRLGHALALLGIIQMIRSAGHLLYGYNNGEPKKAPSMRGNDFSPIKFQPPKALPPPLPNNILSMEQARIKKQHPSFSTDTPTQDRL